MTLRGTRDFGWLPGGLGAGLAKLETFFVRVEMPKVVVPQQVFAKGANFLQVGCYGSG